MMLLEWLTNLTYNSSILKFVGRCERCGQWDLSCIICATTCCVKLVVLPSLFNDYTLSIFILMVCLFKRKMVVPDIWRNRMFMPRPSNRAIPRPEPYQDEGYRTYQIVLKVVQIKWYEQNLAHCYFSVFGKWIFPKGLCRVCVSLKSWWRTGVFRNMS